MTQMTTQPRASTTPPQFSPDTTNVCVVGLGYIGLPTAAVLASRGFQVDGMEVNPKVVEIINSGRPHIVEPDLDMVVRAAVQTGRLRARTEPVEASVFMVCVPTPLGERNTPDLTYVEKATKTICPYLRPGALVILESTSPPGTTERMAQQIEEATGLGADQIYVAHAPERVLPGKILREVTENDRIVGGVNEAATEVCAQFYKHFVTGELLLTDARTAECAKLVENAFRDVNIAFANELSLLADELNIDVLELIALANRHPRVEILNPGPGVGGHCLAVDPWFIVSAVPDLARLIRTAREVNDAKPEWVAERVKRRATRFRNPKIACLGLAYKPDIDDLRESPALDVVRSLRDHEVGELLIVEPNLEEHEEFELCGLDEALAQADLVVLLVAHRQFRKISPKQLVEKVIIDTCGVLAPPKPRDA